MIFQWTRLAAARNTAPPAAGCTNLVGVEATQTHGPAVNRRLKCNPPSNILLLSWNVCFLLRQEGSDRMESSSRAGGFSSYKAAQGLSVISL